MAKQIDFDKFHGDKPVQPDGAISALGEPHLACVLLLDVSGSMYGEPIENLSRALERFREAVYKDELARKRVDIAIVTFSDDIQVINQMFLPVEQMEERYELRAYGDTMMAEAIMEAVTMVRQRNHEYEDLGVTHFKPWIFMITDGESHSFAPKMEQAIRLVHEQEEKGRLSFWALGTGEYNSNQLFALTKRVIELKEQNFEGIFDWLSESMVTISNSRVGENVVLSDLPANARKADPDRSIDEGWM